MAYINHGKPSGLKPGQKALCGAGRKKGTPNKKTNELIERIQAVTAMDWDPVTDMAKIARTGYWELFDPVTMQPTGKYEAVDQKIRARCLEEVASYIFPKRRAIEVSDPAGNPVQLGLNIGFVSPMTISHPSPEQEIADAVTRPLQIP